MEINNKLFYSFIFVAIVTGGYYYYDYKSNLPCTKPILYSIGNLDERFGLSRSQFLDNISRAENVWNLALNKKLFQYSADGPLKINLDYDYRQQATITRGTLDTSIKNTQASYDALKAKYNQQLATYQQAKSTLENELSIYKQKKAAYNGNEQDRLSLNAQVVILNQKQNDLTALSKNINSTVSALNSLGRALNLDIKTYNNVVDSVGEQFSEGEYIRDETGERINIYQFNDANKLIRVLEHELGHALGLDHLNNPKAIMYYMNSGINEALTADDIRELKVVCGIKG